MKQRFTLHMCALLMCIEPSYSRNKIDCNSRNLNLLQLESNTIFRAEYVWILINSREVYLKFKTTTRNSLCKLWA